VTYFIECRVDVCVLQLAFQSPPREPAITWLAPFHATATAFLRPTVVPSHWLPTSRCRPITLRQTRGGHVTRPRVPIGKSMRCRRRRKYKLPSRPKVRFSALLSDYNYRLAYWFVETSTRLYEQWTQMFVMFFILMCVASCDLVACAEVTSKCNIFFLFNFPFCFLCGQRVD